MIAHFKLIMDGIRVPPGEIYCVHEAPNGELGFYLVCDGTGRPRSARALAVLRAHGRRAARMLEGYQLADVVPDLRHDQHDRRGVRPMKHLIRRVRRRCARRFPARLRVRRWCCRACAASRRTAARRRRADIDGLAAYARRAAHPDRGSAVAATRSSAAQPVGRWHVAGLPQHRRARCAAPTG